MTVIPGRKNSRLMSAVYLLSGAAIISYALFFSYDDIRFVLNSTRTVATVVENAVTVKEVRHYSRAVYSPLVAYTDFYGKTHKAQLDSESLKAYEKGSVLEIRYGNDSREDARYSDFSSRLSLNFAICLFGLAFAGLGIFQMRQLRAERRARLSWPKA